MKFKSLNEEEPVLSSIAPLIDIVFLLLIFFMATTHSASLTGMSVSLPETGHKDSTGNDPQVKITIAGNGSIILLGTPVEIESLKKKLEHSYPGEGRFNVILEADKNVKHGTVVEVMDAAKQAGAQSIIIAAYLNEPEEQ
jgi:biopolymer transport protein ExbD